MTTTGTGRIPLASTGDTYGQQWIGYPDADAWTITITDERTGDTYVRHSPTSPGSRRAAIIRAAGVLGLLCAEIPEEERSPGLWEAVQDLLNRLMDAPGRVEVASRLHGLRVALQPTDPHHPANT